jgi:hypothetical protein
MTITYYSVLFYKYKGNKKFSHNGSTGFTSDENLHSRVMKINDSEVDGTLYPQPSWAGSLENDGKGEAADIEDVKKQCGGDLAEETSPGCWSTAGCA